MNANVFPLILIGATVFTGAVWLLEAFVLRPRRLAAAGDVPDEEPARPAVVEYSISFFPVILLVLVFRSFLLEPFQIPSGSMIPTLEVGDFIVVNKYAYGVRVPVLGTRIIDVGEPKNGDVMVFIPPHKNEYFIKRVIGVPGDTVTYDEDKGLTINGELIERTLDIPEPEGRVASAPGSRPGCAPGQRSPWSRQNCPRSPRARSRRGQTESLAAPLR